MTNAREQIEFDVLFVGGGPANLAGAIQLMQLAGRQNLALEVALIEKGADIGSHALSGAIVDPIAVKELIPNYKEVGCPIENDVRGDSFYVLTKQWQYAAPFVPKYMKNKGFHIISLSRFVRWLASIAQDLGVNIFPGFAGSEVLYDQDDKTVIGIRTGDKGIGHDGQPKSNFEPGIDIIAKVTSFGEGAKGSLLREIAAKLRLFDPKAPQTFETGIKEVIQLPESNFFSDNPVNDIHTLGYPLDLDTHSGGFIYEMKNNKVSVGLVVGLGYHNPMIDLYEEFIRFKKHPFVRGIISGGKVVEQGSRTLGNGSYYTMPKLAVDGAVFVGASASMLNAPALKGIHTSMKSGMLAAKAILEALIKGDFTQQTLYAYHDMFNKSWLKDEVYEGRNFAQALSKKIPAKIFHLGAQYLTRGRGFVNKMSIKKDSNTLSPLKDGDLETAKKRYGEHDHDDVLFLDKLTGVYMSKTQHREDQPCHLIIHNPELCVNECLKNYRSPCTRFCPGNVYEMEIKQGTQEKRLKLNPSNCLHCKTCEIKDPYENITWTCPEGGDGPKYTML